MINSKKYNNCLHYIRNHWDKLTCYLPKDRQLHFGLPNKYIVASRFIFNKDQFYWDSYFIIVGLIASGKIQLAKGMVENLTFLFNRFGIVPMRNRYYNTGTSQIPFLTSMIEEVFSATKDKAWLRKTLKVAELELRNYWMNKKLTEKHLAYKDLSRYCDHYITHLGAEHESGWDMTSRFNDRCLDYLPIDLNCCLYKYETDLAEGYKLLKQTAKHTYFKKSAEKRKKTIVSLMWNQKSSFFFDYNYALKKQSKFYSVAGFYPLWAKLATHEQAKQIRDHVLHRFDREGGITNTQAHGLSKDLKQHDSPNGWPQQQWIVIKGLLNYGFKEDAERIAGKWLDMNAEIFSETGKFWEKHNVVTCEIGIHNQERYATQSGFGWTNAIFTKLVSVFSK